MSQKHEFKKIISQVKDTHSSFNFYFIVGLYSPEVKVNQSIIEILVAEIDSYKDGHQYVMDGLHDYKVNSIKVTLSCCFLEIRKSFT